MSSGPDEDPERRIAELEPPLLGSAGDAEVSRLRPRVGLRLGWVALGLMIVGLIVGGAAILAGRGGSQVGGRPTAPPMIGGGATVAESSAAPTFPSSFPSAPPIPPVPSVAAPGGVMTVSGAGNQRTINCADNEVAVSGVDNSVVLTGHCSRVDVSGVRNTVTIDSTDAIVVSGVNNAVTFHSGSPALDKSGLDNTVEQG